MFISGPYALRMIPNKYLEVEAGRDKGSFQRNFYMFRVDSQDPGGSG